MLQLESVGDAQLEELQALLAAGAGIHVEMEERDHLLAQAKVRSGVWGGYCEWRETAIRWAQIFTACDGSRAGTLCSGS